VKGYTAKMIEHLWQVMIEYQMTNEEKFAFRLAMIYIELSRKYFPEYKHYTLPKHGDPRKSNLFRHCWKLMNTTKGKLKPEEYRFYIQAQMSVLAGIKINGAAPYINPNCLVGEAAWKRWLVWQKYFNELKKTAEPIITEDFTKEVIKRLHDDHYALTVRLGELTKDKIKNEIDFILKLNKMNVISPYFILLNPVMKNCKVEFDKDSYSKKITNESLKVYKRLFKD